jgi:hypothetical protein
MMKSRTITCSIDRPPSVVYEFASNPENLPQWVRSFCLTVRKSGSDWQMETPTGWVGIQFVPANDFGVLDHVVTLPDGQAMLNPMRVVANGEGSEVIFTLFQLPGMTDEQFANDAGMVEADLRTLKDVLEGVGPAPSKSYAKAANGGEYSTRPSTPDSALGTSSSAIHVSPPPNGESSRSASSAEKPNRG